VRGLELTADDLLRRDIIQALTCHFALSKEAFEVAYLIDFDTYFAEELEEINDFVRHKMVALEKDWITVTPKSRLLIRNICMTFDKYLRDDLERKRYSKVI
jgi:oxygen-independent coproporphyrinogen-3 oxidase